MSRIRKVFGLNLQHNEYQPISLPGEVRIRYTGGELLEASFDTGPYKPFGGSVSGTGTQYHLPRWKNPDGTGLENTRLIDDNATNIRTLNAGLDLEMPVGQTCTLAMFGYPNAILFENQRGGNIGWYMTEARTGTAVPDPTIRALSFQAFSTGGSVCPLQIREDSNVYIGGPIHLRSIQPSGGGGVGNVESPWPGPPDDPWNDRTTTLYYDDNDSRTYLWDKSVSVNNPAPQYRPIPRFEGHHVQAVVQQSGGLPTTQPRFWLYGSTYGDVIDSAKFGWTRYGADNNNFQIYALEGTQGSGAGTTPVTYDVNIWVNYYASWLYGTWQARLQTVTGGNTSSIAGLIIRDAISNNGDTWFMMVGFQYGLKKVWMQWRQYAGDPISGISVDITTTFPIWLRMVVTATQIEGYYSTDGTTWVQIGVKSWSTIFPMIYGWTAIPNGGGMTTANFEAFQFPGVTATVAGSPIVTTYAMRSSLRFTGTGIQGIADDAANDCTTVTVARGAGLTVVGENQSIAAARGFITLRGTNWKVTDDSANNSVIVESTTGQSSWTGEFNAKTTSQDTATDPGNGNLVWNNTTLDSATVLAFDDQTKDGRDVRSYIATTQAGYQIYLQLSSDSNRWQKWNVTSITPQTGYTQIAVSFVGSNGTAFGNANDLLATFIPPGGGAQTFTVTAPLVFSSGNLSIPKADAMTDGYLAHADWVKFNAASSIATGSPNYLLKYDTPTTVKTSQVLDNGDTGIAIVNPQASFDMSQISLQTSYNPGSGVVSSYGIWRYRHDSAGLWVGGNTTGEMQLFLNDTNPSMVFGNQAVVFTQDVIIKLPSSYSGVPFEIDASDNTQLFKVDKTGNLVLIAGLTYTWPSTPPGTTTSTVKLLQYNASTKVLTWIDPPAVNAGATSGRAGFFPIFDYGADGTGTAQLIQDTGHLKETSGGTSGVTWATNAGFSARAYQTILAGDSTHRTILGWFTDKIVKTGYQYNVGTDSSFSTWMITRSPAATSPYIGSIGVNSGGYVTVNSDAAANVATAMLVRPANAGDNGFYCRPLVAGPYSGYAFLFQDSAGSSEYFAVAGDGNLEAIRGRFYLWPSGTLPDGSTTARVLGYTNNPASSSNVAQLAWISMTAPSGVGTQNPTAVNTLTKFAQLTPSVLITNSQITDDGTDVTVAARNLILKQNQAGTDFTDVYWRANAATAYDCQVRWQHLSTAVATANQNYGEMQWFFPGDAALQAPSFFVGRIETWIQGSLRVRQRSGLTSPSNNPLEVWSTGQVSSPARFIVDDNGDLIRIKNQPYLWPAAGTLTNGYALVVQNAGTGQLQWANVTAASVTGRAMYHPVFAGTSGQTGQALGDTGYLQEDTANRWLGYNVAPSGAALKITPQAAGDGGVWVVSQSGFTGLAFAYNTPTNTGKFWVNASGDLQYIANLQYAWPTAALQNVTASSARVLGYTSNPTGSPPKATLSWIDLSTYAGIRSAGTTTASYLTMWSAPGATITDSPIYDGLNAASQASIFITRDFLYGRADGTLNLGDGNNRVSSIYVANAFWISMNSTDPVNPSTVGFLTSPASSPNAAYSRYLVAGGGNYIQSGRTGTANQAGRLTIGAYHSIELRGSRRTTSSGQVSTVSGNESFGVLVWQEANDVVPLWVDSQLTLTSDLLRLRNNASDKLRVNSLGSLITQGGTQFGTRVWQPNGGFGGNLTESITGTALNDYYTILVDTVNAGANMTLTLPDPTTCDGRVWHVVMVRRNSSTVSASPWTLLISSSWAINLGAGTMTLSNSNANTRDVLITADGKIGVWWVSSFNAPAN